MGGGDEIFGAGANSDRCQFTARLGKIPNKMTSSMLGSYESKYAPLRPSGETGGSMSKNALILAGDAMPEMNKPRPNVKPVSSEVADRAAANAVCGCTYFAAATAPGRYDDARAAAAETIRILSMSDCDGIEGKYCGTSGTGDRGFAKLKTTRAVGKKVATANKDRDDSLARPQSMCPDVQPLQF